MKCILLFLFVVSCRIQNEIPPHPVFEQSSECEESIGQAKLDYKNGKRKFIILGLVQAGENELFYFDFMKRKYNIVIESNCVPSQSEECYAIAMNDEILKEYGENFIQKTLNEAEAEFRKQ